MDEAQTDESKTKKNSKAEVKSNDKINSEGIT